MINIILYYYHRYIYYNIDIICDYYKTSTKIYQYMHILLFIFELYLQATTNLQKNKIDFVENWYSVNNIPFFLNLFLVFPDHFEKYWPSGQYQ